MSRGRREVRAFQKRREREKGKAKKTNEGKGGSKSRIDWSLYR